MDTKDITCINCPMGCSLKISIDDNGYSIKGNSCKRGIDYGISEMTHPKRAMTTSVFVKDGVSPTVSVKTISEVPKGLMLKAVRELSGLTVNAPVRIGDVVFKNVQNTGIDIVATRNVDRRNM